MSLLNSIQPSSKILIVTPRDLTLVDLLCTTALVKYVQKLTSNIHVLMNSDSVPTNYHEIFKDIQEYIIPNLNTTDFSAFLGNDTGVEDIEIEKQEDGFKMIFKTFEGKLNLRGLELKPETIDTEVRIYVGSNSINYLGTDVAELTENNIYLKDKFKDPLGIATANTIFKSTERIESDVATLLLAAVMYETIDVETGEGYEIINRLLFRHKANFKQAQDIVKQTTAKDLKQWKKEVYENIIIKDTVVYSVTRVKQIDLSVFAYLPAKEKLGVFSNLDIENKVVITVINEFVVLFLKGEILDKAKDLEINYANLNAGIATIITRTTLDEILDKFELEAVTPQTEELVKEIDRESILLDIDKIETINNKQKLSNKPPREPEKEKNKDKQAEKQKNERVGEEKKQNQKQNAIKQVNEFKKENINKQNQKPEYNVQIKQSDTPKVENKVNEASREVVERSEGKPSEKQVPKNTSVLKQQQPQKISVINSTNQKPQSAPRSFDPLPPANW